MIPRKTQTIENYQINPEKSHFDNFGGNHWFWRTQPDNDQVPTLITFFNGPSLGFPSNEHHWISVSATSKRPNMKRLKCVIIKCVRPNRPFSRKKSKIQLFWIQLLGGKSDSLNNQVWIDFEYRLIVWTNLIFWMYWFFGPFLIEIFKKKMKKKNFGKIQSAQKNQSLIFWTKFCPTNQFVQKIKPTINLNQGGETA